MGITWYIGCYCGYEEIPATATGCTPLAIATEYMDEDSIAAYLGYYDLSLGMQYILGLSHSLINILPCP
jgi:hypothetical protein